MQYNLTNYFVVCSRDHNAQILAENATKSISVSTLTSVPAGELSVLPSLPITGFKGGERCRRRKWGRRWKGMMEGESRKGKGRKGRQGKGQNGMTPTVFKTWICLWSILLHMIVHSKFIVHSSQSVHLQW